MLIFCKSALANKTYRFAVNSPGAPPYLYIDPKSDTYVGLLNDVLQEASHMHGLSFEFLDSNRVRNETLLNTNKIDAFLLSKVWLKNPNQAIASIPLFSHRMFLYKMKPFEDSFTLSQLKGHKICTRDGYIYPSLTKMTENGFINRVDSSSKISVMNMLVAGRCDYAIMNEFNAAKVFDLREFKDNTFYMSPRPSDKTHTEIILRPELTKLKTQLDQTIAAMQSDGSLSESLQFHVKMGSSPKN